MAGCEHVFRPLRIGRVTSRNRIESSPAIPFLASPDYFVTSELIEWHRAQARGNLFHAVADGFYAGMEI